MAKRLNIKFPAELLGRDGQDDAEPRSHTYLQQPYCEMCGSRNVYCRNTYWIDSIKMRRYHCRDCQEYTKWEVRY